MTDEELKKYVKDRVMSFVGRTDEEQVKIEMKAMLLEVTESNPDRIEVIFQAIQEGPENANTQTMDGSC